MKRTTEGMVMHAYNPSALAARAGEIRDWASLGYGVRDSLHENKKDVN